jgi:NAD(P)-dependent dehydrogenase (short-subunit alcohol dehydrogenase family)
MSRKQIEKWLGRNTSSLVGKTVAVTGTTGGIGRELCRELAGLGASLILMDRCAARSEAFRDELTRVFGVSVKCIGVELENIDSVRAACEGLRDEPVDVFIHNAGAYSIPRHKCTTGLDNVYQINFASPYYIIRELWPQLRRRQGRVVVVGSIAHNYSRADFEDIDFSTRRAASKVYGNAKRYLMFSLYELFAAETDVSLAVTHPGITLTNITAHYPKVIFAVIKHPMKIIFMCPGKACLSILNGVFEACGYHEWIGPRVLDVWGLPRRKRLRTCPSDESRRIGEVAEEIYCRMKGSIHE